MPGQCHVYMWLRYKRPGAAKTTSHASLELSDGTYISWAPSRSTSDASVGSGGNMYEDIEVQTYQEDIERECKKPDRAYIIKGGKLDERAILGWWTRWRREEAWRVQMPVLPMYTIFEALSVGLKGFDGNDSKGLYMTHTHLIDYMKSNKLVVSSGQCIIL